MVLEIYDAVIVEECLPVLKSVADELRIYRAEGGATKILAKLLNNALYGRLGSPIVAKQTVVTEHVSKIPNYASYIKIGPYYIYEIEKKNKKYRNIALAAAITAKARILLYETMLIIEQCGGRILYCDTDSILWALAKEQHAHMKYIVCGKVEIKLNLDDP